MTKGIIADGQHSAVSLRWVGARRGLLNVFEDRLECGDWVIPYQEIQQASLVPGGFLFPGYVLKVSAGGTTYQFGLDYASYWRSELPFRVDRLSRSIGLTLLAWSVRLLIAGAIAYEVWRRY